MAVENPSYKFCKHREIHEELIRSLDEIIAQISDRIDYLKYFEKPPKGVRALQSVRKRLRAFQKQYFAMLFSVRHLKRCRKSGLGAPKVVPSDLANFLGLDPTEKYSRIDLTRSLSKYITSHRLQNPSMRSEILPDPPMRALFSEEFSGHSFTYNEMQKILAKFFANRTS